MSLDTKTLDSYHVLLIEDNQEYANILKTRLLKLSVPPFHVEHSVSLQSGFARLKESKADVILLDLSLPDSQGLETLARTHAKAPDAAIVVLTGVHDERLGIEALRQGAQDYLVKGETRGQQISKAIRYAAERQEMKLAMQNLSLIDELTGLYNRRGFFSIAEQQLKVAFRTKRELLLVFIDLDYFKRINDIHGHPQGDQALIDLAGILRLTFRDSDIIARVGGDEFAVLAVEALSQSIKNILGRLEENLLNYNAKTAHLFKLSISTGFEPYDPFSPASLSELMACADQKMYRSKGIKHQTGLPEDQTGLS